MALPPEDRLPGEEDQCALLLKSLYGTRDAAYNWTQAYTDVLNKLGFAKGESSPCSFWHKEKQIATIVHGDDFCSEGPAGSLSWLRTELAKSFEIKTEVLGPDADKGEVKELRFLNRVLTWHDQGIDWEADPRHAELITKQLDLEDCRPVVTPGVKDESRATAETSEGSIDKPEGSPPLSTRFCTSDVGPSGSTARRATRTDESAREQEYEDQDATGHAPKTKPQCI